MKKYNKFDSIDVEMPLRTFRYESSEVWNNFGTKFRDNTKRNQDAAALDE